MSVYGFGKNRMKVERLDVKDIKFLLKSDDESVATAAGSVEYYYPVEIGGVKHYIGIYASA